MYRRTFKCYHCGAIHKRAFDQCEECGTAVHSMDSWLLELGGLILTLMLFGDLYYSGKLQFLGLG
ncbi:hypothetical protein A6E00_13510 [Vibrio diabolicus]|uniref:hypothetical protein n=1 Tax=Vibrio diabolicus subgroup TaxID=2315253 RepID=UPI00080F3F9F|nr:MULTISPECIES: hypothetical protein [Vibrio diabolicus subgroup]OCH65481.1 hypothetical protein A6E00_13510 [Vibrio diabolicus]